jgi:hypothetical protein
VAARREGALQLAAAAAVNGPCPSSPPTDTSLLLLIVHVIGTSAITGTAVYIETVPVLLVQPVPVLTASGSSASTSTSTG